MAVQVASLVARLSVDKKQFDSGIKAAGTKFDKFAGLAIGGAAAAATAIVAVGTAAIGAGIAVGAAANRLDSSMRLVQARTGATAEEMDSLGESVVDVWQSNWGQSIDDVAQSLATVHQVTGQVGDALEDSTRKAIIMRDVFGKDILETTRAVDTAMINFGVSSAKAFDMLTKVIQETGDPADDLADTVNEYSVLFAQAGFSAEEMFGILKSGLDVGARNFDVVADAVKEFGIRIIDGSDTTRDALHKLFARVALGEDEFNSLQNQINETSKAMDIIGSSLDDARKKFEEQRDIVNDLEGAYNDTIRALEKLTRPNLAGMDEFDDKLFNLEQQARKLQLQMLDVAPDSATFDSLNAQLDAVNTQIERITLQRDIRFEEQLHSIDKATRGILDPMQTFDSVMAQIGQRKTELAGINQELSLATNAMNNQGQIVGMLQGEYDRLTEVMNGLQAEMVEAGAPATTAFLQQLADGTISPRDALSQVLEMLTMVDDKIVQNTIGVDLFGTKWEDLGPQVIMALDPAQVKLDEFAGATDAAGEAVSGGLGATLSEFFRNIQGAFIPALEILNEKIGPILTEFAEKSDGAIGNFASTLAENVGPMLDKISASLVQIADAFGLVGEDATGVDAAVALLTQTLETTISVLNGVASTIEFLSGVISPVIKKFNQLEEAVHIGGERLGLGGVANLVSAAIPFQHGGIVPGPSGVRRSIMAEGGEAVLTPQQIFNLTVNSQTQSAGIVQDFQMMQALAN